ncbi:hypothetical protein BJ973_008769 [Actinoplanes tereljensis]
MMWQATSLVDPAMRRVAKWRSPGVSWRNG